MYTVVLISGGILTLLWRIYEYIFCGDMDITCWKIVGYSSISPALPLPSTPCPKYFLPNPLKPYPVSSAHPNPSTASTKTHRHIAIHLIS
jgi:hypothetical protein